LVREELRSGHHLFWLTTTSQGGVPHVVPVFAAWDGVRCYVATSPKARKTRHLTETGRCVLAASTGDAHVVIEAIGRRVRDRDEMERASAAFQSRGWPTTVVDDELHAPFAAPTSGGSPFQVWELEPVKAFGFPADGESNAPTRWTFDRGREGRS
jgi:Pyridoxamine 5'-phosphate oxidase